MPGRSRSRSRPKDAHADANRLLAENDVVWVQCQFVDINGRLRSYSVPAEDFLKGGVWDSGMSFDGSSVGFRRAEDSDLLSRPDLSPPGHGSLSYCESLIWEARDRDQGFGMFPWFGGRDYFDAPPNTGDA